MYARERCLAMMKRRSPALPRSVRRRLSASRGALVRGGVVARGVAGGHPARSVAAARQAFKDGEDAEARGDLLIALDKFKAAAAIKATAQLLVRIGAVQEKLGRLVDAIASYERGLERAAALPAVAKVAREQIDALRARVPKVTLVVPSPPPELGVSVGGAPFSPSAFGTPVPIDPGPHRLHGQAPGFSPRDQAFTVAERGSERIELSLVPGPDRGPVRAPTPVPVADAGPSRWPGAVLVAGGGAALVAGVAMLVTSYLKDGTVNTQCGGSARTGCLTSMQAVIESEIKTINTLRIGSIPVGLAGIAGAAVGVYLLARSPAPAAVAARLVPLVGPGPLGVALQGRF